MRALVLGAYGHYGRIICQKLTEIPAVTVIGAGKRPDCLSSLANELDIETVVVDWRDKELAGVLMDNDIHLVIHAAGPFHNQDYSVAQACIEARCYYVDIADDRGFVSGIQMLDESAASAGVLVASGMGLLALTDSIAEYLQDTVSSISHMDIGYSGCGRMPGRASVLSSLHTCGQAVATLEEGKLIDVIGLGDGTPHHFGQQFMSRDLVNIDGPELEFLTAKYCLKSISLKAGYGERGPKIMSMIARMVARGWIKDRMALVTKLMRFGRASERFSQGKGGLFVEVEGRDKQDKVVERVYEIHTRNHRFEELKISPVLAFVNRLLSDFVPHAGAQPAMGLIFLEDVLKTFGEDDVTIYKA
jgi:saccharopine dehydrogenase-like NADP-dependent oxidoreductase